MFPIIDVEGLYSGEASVFLVSAIKFYKSSCPPTVSAYKYRVQAGGGGTNSVAMAALEVQMQRERDKLQNEKAELDDEIRCLKARQGVMFVMQPSLMLFVSGRAG